MTASQYWDEDVTYARAYRKAFEYNRKRENEQAWWQGAYYYAALCRAAPLFRSLSPSEPDPYLDRPIPITKEDIEADEIRQMKEAAENFAEYAEAKNTQMRKKSNTEGGGGIDD